MLTNTEKEENNPCLKEQEMSYKCLNDNNFVREKCELHFRNYQKCKDFWGMVRSDRRSKGIRPHMPPASEREEIKRTYLNLK